MTKTSPKVKREAQRVRNVLWKGVAETYKTQRDLLQAENDRLTAWVNDLQAGCYVNCVYCGHRYGPDAVTPVSMADVLKAHVESCPQHPMSALMAELAELNSLIELQRKRTREADEAWRQAHPGNENVWPDLGKVVGWLMSERTRLQAKLDARKDR